MISYIEVKKLFGVFTHRIKLDTTKNITLILGENGLGKTIILKLVQAFCEGNLAIFREYVYEVCTLEFTDGTKLVITRTVKAKMRPDVLFEYFGIKKKKPLQHLLADLDIFSHRNQRHFEYFNDSIYRSANDRRFLADDFEMILERYLPTRVDRVGVDKWVEPGLRNVYSSEQLIKKYAAYLPPEFRELYINGTPEWLVTISSKIPVKLIETQRLLVKAEEGKYRSSVMDYSKQLLATIKNKRSEATDLGSNLDRTYPNRVIAQIESGVKADDSFIKQSFISLQEKRELLNDVGLLDTEEEQLQPLNDSGYAKKILNEVLSVYIEDSYNKLNIYDDLSSRIKLLLDIINKRFTYKKLSIDKSEGFRFNSTINNKVIPLNGLSSGEQHELVLFFELLFNTKESSLLLIDEPEISLHISWQKEFINDLSSVAQLNNLTIIIATHSPDIIGNNWDLTVQLKGIN
jgi:predicted ATP-binding protein involved in virulence